MTLYLSMNSIRQVTRVVSAVERPLVQSRNVLITCRRNNVPLLAHNVTSCSRCLCSSSTVCHSRPLSKSIGNSRDRIDSNGKSYRYLLDSYPSHVLKYDQRILSSIYLEQLLHHRRSFHSSRVLCEKEPSSKVEQTVNALKEQVLKKEEQKGSCEPAPTEWKAVDEAKSTKSAATVVEVPKRSIAKRVWDEIVHYYHGFRLLFIDIRIASRLLLKSMRGNDLSRREYRQLTRTTADIFRLVPFSIFIIVPFMELLLPVFLKFFPGMLPSTFQSAKDKETKIKQQLKVKLDMTRFLQTTLDEMALESKGESHSHAAKQFAEFFSKVRETGQIVSNEDILKFSKLFEDEITLDSLSRPQLIALCRLLELKPVGPDNFLRFQLRMQLRSLKSDDRMIQTEGVTSLTVPELQQACRARGMRALGVAEERLRTQLQQWLELSLNEKIPPSLLLLSRVLYLPENLPATDQLKATIQSLPLGVGTEAKYKIGETEGKIDNKTRLEMIKQEEAAIKKEKEEAEKARKEKEAAIAAASAVPAEAASRGDILVDKAGAIEDKAEAIIAKTEEQVSKDDLESLEEALEQIEHDKKSLVLEKEELEDIKEEMADYKEDIEEFKAIRQITGKKELHESKAAKVLRKRLDRMVKKMDKVMSDLEMKKEKLEEKIEYLRSKEGEVIGSSTDPTNNVVSSGSPSTDPTINVVSSGSSSTSTDPTINVVSSGGSSIKVHSDNLVNINELLTNIKKLQKVEDEDKIKRIIDVLDSMDVDHDGAVEVEHVVKVLELLGRENVNVSSDQMKQLVKLLIQEEKEDDEERRKKVEGEGQQQSSQPENTK